MNLPWADSNSHNTFRAKKRAGTFGFKGNLGYNRPRIMTVEEATAVLLDLAARAGISKDQALQEVPRIVVGLALAGYVVKS